MKKKKHYIYNVLYITEPDENSIGYSYRRATANLNRPIDSVDVIEAMEEDCSKQIGRRTLLLNYTLLRVEKS